MDAHHFLSQSLAAYSSRRPSSYFVRRLPLLSLTFNHVPCYVSKPTNHIGDTPAKVRAQNADMNPRVAVLGGPEVPARRAAHVMASSETVILHASLQQHIAARPRAARIPDTGERVLHPVCSRDCCSCELLHYLEGQHNAR